MSELNTLFRSRIGLAEEAALTFASLDKVLEKTAKTIAFENLRIIEKRTQEISKANLINKILIHKEGGLCYELNTILYYFLMENGFEVRLARGIVYNQEAQEFPSLGRTHVFILLTHENQVYVVDTGFGGNLPLKPVPLNGEPVSSDNGDFRILREEGEHGNFVLEMKVKDRDSAWKTGYAFDSKRTVTQLAEINAVQQLIVHDPRSSFNKSRMITRLTDQGNITLTETSLTRREGGQVTKQVIDSTSFKDLLHRHFGQ
ncbi:N-hydroxyarylamine O-acetyltransferase [Paenibacillus sp. UNCCL117]|uniref:arylamine N-acetyltransferase family protein n=1 Tax=unclassified Paenibacillus TaxID=185978 RepID=UPI00088BEE96|nr:MULTISPECIES: arylamine N-acetyltransferase [unclassified Paenibacillus]SDC71789.1 N-hydroxyarylamine O-acetyltransferase [Paenibacillus sp. cl123]SFW24576.1 N-hydroxyarylamine O-acetyltransferase [Paenibacillus sp. UNCCL117]